MEAAISTVKDAECRIEDVGWFMGDGGQMETRRSRIIMGFEEI